LEGAVADPCEVVSVELNIFLCRAYGAPSSFQHAYPGLTHPGQAVSPFGLSIRTANALEFASGQFAKAVLVF
jgi:hypothetical protein